MALHKIPAINTAIGEWFSIYKEISIVPAKDLMPWFIEKGIFEDNHKDGWEIREVLRELERTKQLHLIPSVKPERKLKKIYWFFIRLGANAQQTINTSPNPVASTQHSSNKKGRSGSDEYYVIDLCDEVLGMEASRQHTFPFLLGDVGTNGNRRKLRVDAYYPSLSLVIEYYENQHTKSAPIFDKVHLNTISGMNRAEQRRLYDARRKEVLPKHGIQVLSISYSELQHRKSGKLKKDRNRDLEVVQAILKRELGR